MINELGVILNLLKLIIRLDFKAISQKRSLIYIYKNIYAKLIFREVLLAAKVQQMRKFILLHVWG